MTYGHIHSIQSFGAVDGPGLRSVVFFQGCPLRCIYCHNPDTWKFGEGTEMSADDVIAKVRRFYQYIKKGGVTLSGGECLMQPDFAAELLEGFKKLGLHTAVDTSGICDIDEAKKVLVHTDLVICDIKFATEEEYKKNTFGSFGKVKEFLALTEEMNIPLWIRHVVVPSITDSEDYARSIISEAQKYKNLQKIEFLPFRKLCIPKYDALGMTFPLKDTPDCPKKIIESLTQLIDKQYR